MGSLKDRMKHSRAQAFGKNLVTFSTTLALFFLAAEVATRALYHPANLGQVIQFDERLGWSLKPDGYLHTVDTFRDFDYEIKINSLGLRDRELSKKKKPGITRILTLGDSFAFGTGVDAEWRFSDVLGRALDDGVEVLNAAVAGWGTDQEMIYYEHLGRQFEPDVVILTVMIGNDVLNNLLDHLFLDTAPKPRFVLEEEQLRLIDQNPRAPVPGTLRLKLWLRESRFIVFVKRRIDMWTYDHEPCGEPGQFAVPQEWLKKRNSHWRVFAKTYDRDFEKAWETTEAIITRLARRCSEDGARLLVFAHPMEIEVDDAWRAELVARTSVDTSQYDFGKPYARLAEFCRRQGLDFVYPLEEFRAASRRQRLFFDLDPHPNRHGHAVAARVLLRVLREKYQIAP